MIVNIRSVGVNFREQNNVQNNMVGGLAGDIGWTQNLSSRVSMVIPRSAAMVNSNLPALQPNIFDVPTELSGPS